MRRDTNKQAVEVGESLDEPPDMACGRTEVLVEL
jgi:hypothetical protein